MDIILLDYIDKVGNKHDVVKVRDGYGRNYLIPKGLAIVANKTNMARLDGLKKQAAKKEMAMLDTYRALAAKLAGVTIQIVSKAGESGRLFGSVTAQNLVDAIREDLGVTIEKRMVEMPEEVKELGAYEAIVKFHPEVIQTLKFEVVRDKKVTDGGTTTTGSGDTAEARMEAPVEAIAAAPVVEEVMEEVEAEVAVVEAAAAEVAEEAVEAAADVAETVEAAAETAAEEVETAVEEAAAEEVADSEDEADKAE